MNISFGNATWFRGKVPNFRMIWRFAWQFIEDSHWQPCLITGGYIIRIYTYMHACIHPSIHPCVHMYIHTYVRTYIPFHCIGLHCIALHCITLHYISLILEFPGDLPWNSSVRFMRSGSTFSAPRILRWSAPVRGLGPAHQMAIEMELGGYQFFSDKPRQINRDLFVAYNLVPFLAICF